MDVFIAAETQWRMNKSEKRTHALLLQEAIRPGGGAQRAAACGARVVPVRVGSASAGATFIAFDVDKPNACRRCVRSVTEQC